MADFSIINDAGAEGSAIATLIYHPEFILHTDYLKAKYFYNVENGCIYWAIQELYKCGIETIDAINLTNMLNSNMAVKKKIEEYNLSDMREFIAMAQYAARHTLEEYKLLANTIIEMSFKRELTKSCIKIQQSCTNSDLKLRDLNTLVNKEITGLLEEYLTTGEIKMFGEKVDEIEKEIDDNVNEDGTSGFRSKIELFNDYFTYEKGEMVLIKAKKKDILNLAKAIDELNAIAQELFSLGPSKKDYINFGQHFTKLESFLKRRELIYANEEERALIAALQARLESIQPGKSEFSGSFKDLQEGLHYYLKQKEDEESVDWIVKNFEQIDGDILNSKPQFEKGIPKVYHFACLSDRDMNQGMSELLPWPLTESFIQAAYDPIDLQFQVYWTALDERSSFLRYSLFYGLFFNRCDVRISYVKQYDDEVTEPYALLPILGLRPEHVAVDNSKRGADYTISIPPKHTKAVKSDWIPMMDMFLCPYRYLLEYVVQKEPVIQGDFLTQKFFDSLLVEAVWNRIQDHPSPVVLKYLNRTVDSECKKYAPFFSFWTNSELFDLKRRAMNFLKNQVVGRKPKVEKMNLNSQNYMQARYEFGRAKFVVQIADSEPVNPYPHFEKLSDRQFPQKAYSYSRIAKEQKSTDLLDEMKAYLNQTSAQENIAIPSDWCTFCPQKGVCVEAFLQNS